MNLTPRLILHYTETHSMNDDNTVRSVSFNFSFCGEYCYAVISKESLDHSFGSVSFGESPSDLHDSFMEAVEETHWDELKECFLKHEAEHNKEYEIGEDYSGEESCVMDKRQLANFARFIVIFNDPTVEIAEINLQFSLSLTDRTTNEEAMDIYLETRCIKLEEGVRNGN